VDIVSTAPRSDSAQLLVVSQTVINAKLHLMLPDSVPSEALVPTALPRTPVPWVSGNVLQERRFHVLMDHPAKQLVDAKQSVASLTIVTTMVKNVIVTALVPEPLPELCPVE